MTFRAFLSGCFRTHQEPVWEGDHLRCLQCGDVIEVLPQVTVKGPAHDPEPVRGEPRMKARRVAKDNVREWKVSQR